jgi:hemerythrin-like domain-containing protein
MKTILFAILVGSTILNPSLANADTKTTAEKPSKQFREEHVEIKKHLLHVEEWAGELSKAKPAQQKELAAKIVMFFKEHIKPHAEWEEKKLYPAVDKRASQGQEVFTSTMRYEHKIVGRWTEELEKASKAATLDTKSFVRKTDQLLGLITAHFEEEEEVLLPVLDKSMTAGEFKKEILSEDHQ